MKRRSTLTRCAWEQFQSRPRYAGRALGAILGCVLSALIVSTPAAAAGKTLTIGAYPWPENVAVTYVWKNLLQHHGYHVKVVSASRSITWAGVAKGNVDLDFEAWLPHVDKAKYDHFKNKVVLIGPWYDKAWQGLAVPNYVHIKTINGLREHAAEFQSHGKAKIYCARAGSVVTQHAQDAVKLYHLPFKAEVASEAGALAILKKDYREKKPVVLTLWQPHWAWGVYHLHMLKDPKHAFAKPNHIYAFARLGFKSSFPQIDRWLNRFHLTEQQLADLMVTMRNSKSPQQGAKTWIGHHKHLVARWFKSQKS